VSEHYDSRFTLPEIDAPGATEAGVVLLGLDIDRLLAGLGFALLADDPALVTQAVDQARHGGFTAGLGELVAAGLVRWRVLRTQVDAVPGSPVTGALRRQWSSAEARVAAAVPGLGPAARAYLTACWIRRDDADRLADREDRSDVIPEVPAG